MTKPQPSFLGCRSKYCFARHKNEMSDSKALSILNPTVSYLGMMALLINGFQEVFLLIVLSACTMKIFGSQQWNLSLPTG